MRVWDIPVIDLCNNHLLGQHREIHAIYSIITNNKNGYAHHPEVERWREHIDALVHKHLATTMEMLVRNMKHKSPLEYVFDNYHPPESWQPRILQMNILKEKNCGCRV
jgi:hypothetical protein